MEVRCGIDFNVLLQEGCWRMEVGQLFQTFLSSLRGKDESGEASGECKLKGLHVMLRMPKQRACREGFYKGSDRIRCGFPRVHW